MIHYIKGKLVLRTENGIVVENNGIGYDIAVPFNSAFYLKHEGEEVCCYTYMAVREDDVSLYGFEDHDSLKLFKLLITVNGVGAKAAMAILSALSADQLKQAILFEDDKAIATAQGVGKKIAQRVVLELKDKVEKLGVLPAARPAEMVSGNDDARSEALDALIALGYGRQEAIEALSGIEGADSQEYIKKALKNLF